MTHKIFFSGGVCHGPRNPTTYFYMLPIYARVCGLTSTLSAKFAQDDIHVVENLDIPTEDPQFILDLIEERAWGSSVLIVDKLVYQQILILYCQQVELYCLEDSVTFENI